MGKNHQSDYFACLKKIATNHVFQTEGSAEHEIANPVKEWFCFLGLCLELVGSVKFLDMLLESLKNTKIYMRPPKKNLAQLTGQSVQLSSERSVPGVTVSTIARQSASQVISYKFFLVPGTYW